jgi:hypothetical protein
MQIPEVFSFVFHFATVGEFEDVVAWTFAESCLLGCGMAHPDRSLAIGSRNPLTPSTAPTMLGLATMLVNF